MAGVLVLIFEKCEHKNRQRGRIPRGMKTAIRVIHLSTKEHLQLPASHSKVGDRRGTDSRSRPWGEALILASSLQNCEALRFLKKNKTNKQTKKKNRQSVVLCNGSLEN
jgi:hypothetical protein